jgi:hypothetical protein
VLNPTNMSDIESYFLLDGMLLLEYCRDCILNHCNGYRPISSPTIFVPTWNALVILYIYIYIYIYFFFFFFPRKTKRHLVLQEALFASLSPTFLVTIKTIHKQTKFSSEAESLLVFRSQENDTRYFMLYSENQCRFITLKEILFCY